MKIERDPESWQDLQFLTAKIFREMGCEAEIEKEVTLVRGTTEVDVYVHDPSHQPPLILLCECKYWSSPVPKNIVHSFRTISLDLGANRGYVISKAGFQRGAFEATKNSNIVLVDWKEFQETFYNRWVISLTNTLYGYANIIFDYMDVLHKRMDYVRWTPNNKSRHNHLMTRSVLYIYANEWSDAAKYGHTFPMSTNHPKMPNQKVTLNNYREYFDLAFSAAPELIEDWKTFFGEETGPKSD